MHETSETKMHTDQKSMTHTAAMKMTRTWMNPNPNGEPLKMFLRSEAAAFTVGDTGVSGSISHIVGGGVCVDFKIGERSEQWVISLSAIAEAAQEASREHGGISAALSLAQGKDKP